MPQNALSYHFKRLRGGGLLRDRHSSADGRDVYYSIGQEHLASLYHLAGSALHQPDLLPGSRGQQEPVADTPLRILFLFTHNSARSQFPEGIARRIGGVRVAAVSAGDTPTDLHPLTRSLITEWGIDPSAQSSKSAETFAGQQFDCVITVCDRVRRHCPTFPGAARQLHWSLPNRGPRGGARRGIPRGAPHPRPSFVGQPLA